MADEVRRMVQVSQSHAGRGWSRRGYSRRMALSARDRRRRITPTVPVGGAERLGAGELEAEVKRGLPSACAGWYPGTIRPACEISDSCVAA